MSLPLDIGENRLAEPDNAWGAKDGLIVPHALTFASIVQSVNKTYSYRWDEAVKHNRKNALAMRRDTYLRALLQERLLPTTKNEWYLEVDDETDAQQKQVQDGLTKALKATWRWRRMQRCLLEAVWYGRYGVQIQWTRDRTIGGLYRVANHKPLNGDKIQYQWDGTPIVMVNAVEAAKFSRVDPGSIVYTDAGAMALRLYKPEYRDRFVIHQHDVDDADYFEGEMAGGVGGVGLRSIVYWWYFIRSNMLDWMVSTMEAIGTTELAVVNYDMSNAEAKLAAEGIAKQLPGKLVVLMPRVRGDKYPSVEFISINTAGIETLKNVINEYIDKGIERLFVGQTLSSNSEGSGMGGTGVADLHRDTKYQLLDWDADNLAETLTENLVEPCKRLNFPWADFPVRLKFSVPNPAMKDRLDTAKILVKDLGVKIRESDVRDLTGFAAPAADEPAVGGSMFPTMDSGDRRATTGGMDVGGLLGRLPGGQLSRDGVDVRGLLDRMVQMQADLQKLLVG